MSGALGRFWCAIVGFSVACNSGDEPSAQGSSPHLRAGLHVEHSLITDDRGETVFLHGVGRQGTEYMCSKYGALFDGPNDQASIDAMRAWNINAVRVFLNEDCWLSINGVDAALSGAPY